MSQAEAAAFLEKSKYYLERHLQVCGLTPQYHCDSGVNSAACALIRQFHAAASAVRYCWPLQVMQQFCSALCSHGDAAKMNFCRSWTTRSIKCRTHRTTAQHPPSWCACLAAVIGAFVMVSESQHSYS